MHPPLGYSLVPDNGGSRAHVAKARRTDGSLVALKRPAGPGIDDQLLLRRERTILATLEHPGVARLVDHGEDEAGPWIAVEWLSSPSLRERLQSPPAPGLTSRLDFLYRAAKLIDELHADGIVHGDLTSEHLIWDDGGHPRLYDFDLAARIATEDGREVLNIGGGLLGTPHFLAPERFFGAAIDVAGDVYAFGCIAFETLAGEVPLLGADLRETAARRLDEQAPRLSCLQPETPTAVDDVVAQCLEREPSLRPSSLYEVVRALRTALEELGHLSPNDADERSIVARAPLIGRAEWIRRLSGQLSETASGRGGLAGLGGESGVGKTRLLGELGRMARNRGMRVLLGECPMPGRGGRSQGAGPRPLLPLLPVVDAVLALRSSTADPSSDPLPRDVGALSVLDPRLAALRTTDLAGTAEATKARTFKALWEMVGALASDRATVLILDDIQWADELTLEFVRWLSGRAMAEAPFQVIFAYRTDEVNGQLRALLDVLGENVAPVGPLAGESVVEMVKSMLGAEPDPHWLDAMVRESGGLPFYVAAYARDVASSGPARTTQLPTPEPIAMLLDRQLERARQLTGPLVDVVAVCGREVDARVLASVLDREPNEMLSAARRLERAGLGQLARGRLCFRHDRLHSHAYARLSTHEREALHGRVADAHLSLWTAETHAEPEAAASHLLASGRGREAVPYLEAAVRRDLQSAATRQALEGLEQLFAQGGHEAPSRRVRWLRLASDAAFALGDLGASTDYARRALETARVPLPRSRAGLTLSLAQAALTQISHRLVQPSATTTQRTELEEAIGCHTRLAQRYLFANDALAVSVCVLHAVNIGDRMEEPHPAAEALAQLGYIVGLTGWRTAATSYLARAERQAAGSTYASCRIYMTRSAYEVGQAQWRAARDACRKGLALARKMSDEQEVGVGETILAYVDYQEGKLGHSARRCFELSADAAKRENLQHQAWGHVTLARVWLARGRYRDALGEVATARSFLPETEDAVTMAFASSFAALAHVNLEEFDEAEAECSAFVDAAEALTSPVFNFAEPLAHAAEVALRLQDAGLGSRTLTSRALRALKRFALGFPVGRPHSLFLSAWFDFSEGRRRRGSRRLVKAKELAATLGMVTLYQAICALEPHITSRRARAHARG